LTHVFHKVVRLPLILASTSPIRRHMLEAAGVEYSTVAPGVDEAPYKIVHDRPEQLALELAAAKALAVSRDHREDWVVGSDSVLTVQGIGRCDKPRDRDDAARQLRLFSDRRMTLTSAVALARHATVEWRHANFATLKVRPLSDAFIEQYLDAEWPEVAYTVGVFRLEARGVQLFEWIDGDPFIIMGMPLLPLLQALRERELIAA
jgi:septum formation protein